MKCLARRNITASARIYTEVCSWQRSTPCLTLVIMRCHSKTARASSKVESRKAPQSSSKRQAFRDVQPLSSTLNEIHRLNIARSARLTGKYSQQVIARKQREFKPRRDEEEDRAEEGVKFPRPLFMYGIAKPFSFPPPNECRDSVVFIGRSNVGKSSLLNALGGMYFVNSGAPKHRQKEVFRPASAARVDDRPGVTRQINIYALASGGWDAWLIDCPGYGFSFSTPEQKQNWKDLVSFYLGGSIDARDFDDVPHGRRLTPTPTSLAYARTIKRVFLLIDARHMLKVPDMDFLKGTFEGPYSSNIKFQVVLTKSDLVKAVDLARRHRIMSDFIRGTRNGVGPVLMVSSTTGAGIQKLRNEIMTILGYRLLENGRVIQKLNMTA